MQNLSIGTPKNGFILRGPFQRLTLVFSFLLTYFTVFAQLNSVIGTLNVPQPAPTSLAKFATVTTLPTVQLSLTLVSTENGPQPIRLKLYIEKGNTLIATGSDVIAGASPVDLSGTMALTSSQIVPYFQFINLQGLSQNQYDAQLEEGLYRLTFEVYHATTNVRLSAPISQSVFITLNAPPTLSQPSNGEQVPSTATNVAFQWSSLANVAATTLTATSYKFTLMEVASGTTDMAALFTGTPKFSETVTGNTTLTKTVAQLALTANKTYAWRVQAVQAGLPDPSYKNNGNSNIYTFTYANTTPCPIVTGLTLTAKASDVIEAKWTAINQHYSYRVAYRKYTTDNKWEWVELPTTNTTFNLTGLESTTAEGIEYEVRISGVCTDNSVGFSEIKRIKTLPKGQLAGCNATTINAPTGNALPTLTVGAVILAGDFPVTVTDLSSASTPFSGKGYISVPWLLGVKIKALFSGITLTEDKKLRTGIIETAYDPTWGNVIDVDGILNGGTNVGIVRTGRDTADFLVNFPIAGVGSFNVVTNSNGGATITISGSGAGQSQTIRATSLPTTIKDSNGNIYSVDASGTVKLIGQVVALNMTSAELNTLSNKAVVNFSAHGKYALDLYKQIYSTDVSWQEKYEKLGTYGVARKAMAVGKPDVLKATIVVNDNTIVPNDVQFVTSKGLKYEKKSLGNNQYEINIVGGPGGDAQELYALYPQTAGKFLSLGKILIASYTPQTKRVVLVPVNGATINETAIAQKLNDVYNPVATQWEVTKDNNFVNATWDISGDGYLEVDGSGFFSSQTSEMLALNKAYRTAREVESDVIYLFVLNRASDATVAGDMPRGKQFGYLFTNTNLDLGQVAAHEVGHGVFKLKHIFDNSYNFKREDLTDNLMNYNNGVELAKYQWDIIHNPGIALGIFDSDDDAQASETGIKTTTIADFVTPNGFLIRLPAQTEILYGCDFEGDLPAGALRRFKTADKKVYNIVTQGNKFSNPDTWHFLGYKDRSGVYYPNTEGVASNTVVRVDQTMLESSASNTATKGQLKLSFSTLSTTLSRYTNGVLPTIKSNIFDGSTNGAAIGQPLEVTKPCATAMALTLPTGFGMSGTEYKKFIESLSGLGKGFETGGICVRIVTMDFETSNGTPKIVHEPKNCGTATDLITLTLRFKDPADGPASVGNGVVMVWTLAGAYSPPCVRDYVTEGVNKLEQRTLYGGLGKPEKLMVKAAYVVYRTVMGLVSCSTNETAAASLKARNGTDAELFTMGVSYELITMMDVLGMAEGIVDIGTMTTKAVVQSYVDYARYSSATIAKIVARQPVTEEEVIYLFISPDKQLFLQGITTAKKIVEELKKEYIGDAYKHGRLTVLVVPIVLSGGVYLAGKAPQFAGRIGGLLGSTAVEASSYVNKLYLLSKKGFTYIKEGSKYVIKKVNTKVGEFRKEVGIWRVKKEPVKPTEYDPRQWSELETQLDEVDISNEPGSGVTPVIVNLVDIKISSESIRSLGNINSNIKLIDGAGNLRGHISRVFDPNIGLRYFYTDYHGLGSDILINASNDLECFLDILKPSEIASSDVAILGNKRLLNGTFDVPPSINQKIRGFGEIMLEDGYKYYSKNTPLDGFYANWGTDAVIYAQYGGESVNLTRFKEAISRGLSNEAAAKLALSGRMAEKQGFTKVVFVNQVDRINISAITNVKILFTKP